MSDIKLFRTNGDTVTQLEGKSVALEKSLQTLLEKHLEVFLGIRFLASEYATGKTHGGRMDTLGIDEDGWPCIIEYKRSTNENVINQGLYYLDWLMDHKAEFEKLVTKAYGVDEAEKIDWSSPRLICIAGNFTKYDEYAVQQINRNIELLRYVRFDQDFLLLEMVRAVTSTESIDTSDISVVKPPPKGGGNQVKSVKDQIERSSDELLEVYKELDTYLVTLGDDIQKKTLKWYIAFKRIKNFLTVVFQHEKNNMLLFVKVDPDSIPLVDGFTRDVRNIGHFGTGSLEITIRTSEDLEKALPWIQESYAAN